MKGSCREVWDWLCRRGMRGGWRTWIETVGVCVEGGVRGSFGGGEGGVDSEVLCSRLFVGSWVLWQGVLGPVFGGVGRRLSTNRPLSVTWASLSPSSPVFHAVGRTLRSIGRGTDPTLPSNLRRLSSVNLTLETADADFVRRAFPPKPTERFGVRGLRSRDASTEDRCECILLTFLPFCFSFSSRRRMCLPLSAPLPTRATSPSRPHTGRLLHMLPLRARLCLW